MRRANPEERHRRHIGREVARDREQEPARDRSQREYAEKRQFRPRFGRRNGVNPLKRRRAVAGQRKPQGDKKRGQPEQNTAPGPRLTIQTEEGFEEKRIGQQSACRAGVRRRVEEVRIGRRGAGIRPREPCLNQGRERCGRDDADPARARQRPEEPEDGRKTGGRFAEGAEFSDRRRQDDAEP